MKRKGYIHVYTGDGKGKTTASLGLALRAVGAGLKVYIGQFIKKRACSELKSLEKFKESITIEQFGRSCFIGQTIKKQDRELARRGLIRIKEVMQGAEFDVVILDEMNIALHYGLLNEEELIPILRNRPEKLEVILTGRNASLNIINLADLVTEMKNVKHYFSRGITAREGIEK